MAKDESGGPGDAIADIMDRLGNGRPPVEAEHFEGTVYQDEDDYYDRYEVGEPEGDLMAGGVRFAVLDYLLGGAFVITVQWKNGGFDAPLPPV
jgi:hypothetical protein